MGNERGLVKAKDGACVSCQRSGRPLGVARLVDPDEGRRLGAADELLYSDLNLALLCEECSGSRGGRRRNIAAILEALTIRFAQRRPAQA